MLSSDVGGEALSQCLQLYLDRSLNWVDKNGWVGWDPYDLWDNSLGRWALSGASLLQRAVGSSLTRLEARFPLGMRRLLRAAPCVNAKAMGLFAAVFLRLEALEGVPRAIKGEPGTAACFRWLEANRVALGGGCGWGYPFDWQSRELIPRNTPTAVTSAIVGDAYWLRYRLRGDTDALDRCQDVCHFFLNALNRSASRADGSFCFSYTPLDRFEVHNANLYAAEFLVRVGYETDRPEWVETGLAAARFSIAEIRDDGTLAYWSNAQSGPRIDQDTYHSGFEIRALHGLARLTGSPDIARAAERYFSVWLMDFFTGERVPHFVRGRNDVIEVHSCAEALLCPAALAADGVVPTDWLVAHCDRVLTATVRALWRPVDDRAGYFAWAARRQRSQFRTTDIPLIRWGQAWMCCAMSAVLSALNARRPSSEPAGPVM